MRYLSKFVLLINLFFPLFFLEPLNLNCFTCTIGWKSIPEPVTIAIFFSNLIVRTLGERVEVSMTVNVSLGVEPPLIAPTGVRVVSSLPVCKSTFL